jgi:replicative DNA helicase
MDLGIPVVVLCQLNRMSDNEIRPPELRDLRDSGSIEQDADIVLMLARHNGNGLMDPNVDMWIRKNRNGVTGNYVGLKGDINRGFTVFYQRESDHESWER